MTNRSTSALQGIRQLLVIVVSDKSDEETWLNYFAIVPCDAASVFEGDGER